MTKKHQFKQKLLEYRDRLYMLSGRNPAIRLLKPSKSRHFDIGAETFLKVIKTTPANFIDDILSGKAVTIANQTGLNQINLELTQVHLQKIIKTTEEQKKERGASELCLAGPFVEAKFSEDGHFMRGPVCLIPLEMSSTRSARGGTSITLTRAGDLEINRALLFYWAKNSNALLPDFDANTFAPVSSTKELVDRSIEIINHLGLACDNSHRDLQTLNIKPLVEIKRDEVAKNLSGMPLLFPTFFISVLNQGKTIPLIKDLESLAKNEIPSVLEPFLDLPETEFADVEAREDFEADSTFDDIPQSKHVYVLRTDTSQERIISHIRTERTKVSVITGPPGTGKSQTICNIIANAIDQDKTVLVISQKRAALDVIAKRFSEEKIGMTAQIALIHDPVKDLAEFSSLLDKMDRESKLKDHFRLNKNFDDIDKYTASLKKLGLALNDSSFGSTPAYQHYCALSQFEDAASEIHTGLQFETADLLESGCLRLQEFGNMTLPPFSNFEENRKDWCTLHESAFEEAIATLAGLNTNQTILEIRQWLANREHRTQKIPVALSTISRFPDWMALIPRATRKIYQRYVEKQIASAILTCENLFDQTFLTSVLNLERPELTSDLLDLISFIDTWKSTFREFDYLAGGDPGLRAAVTLLRKNNQPADRWSEILRYEHSLRWAKAAERKHSALTTIEHDGLLQNQVVNLKKLVSEKATAVAISLRQRWIERANRASAKSLLQSLRELLNRKRNRPSIRTAIEKVVHRPEFKNLFPVWLASPEAASSLFPMKTDLFDLVIFDEASQCRIEESLASIARGKQIIIAGDPNQLPPGSFGEANDEDDSDDSDFEKESLMTFAIGLANSSIQRNDFSSFTLQWHYRSKYEQLIQFSNYGWCAVRARSSQLTA